MRAAHAIAKALEMEGVEVIFGIPGGAILEVYDALYDSNITHITTRHEQGATHAADGYARASGKVGVAFATSGPGATNTCLLYTSPSPRDLSTSRMPSSA